MTSDKSIESNLKYLDDILKHLINYASHYTLSFPELYEKLYGRDFESDDKFNAMNHLILISEETDFFNTPISNNQKAFGEKLVEACYYLKENGFINICAEFNIKITFSGILKHSYGFVQDFQKEQKNEKRLRHVEDTQKIQNRWLIFLTSLIALGTVVSAIYYLTLMICNT
jgi:hypothetical protein